MAGAHATAFHVSTKAWEPRHNVFQPNQKFCLTCGCEHNEESGGHEHPGTPTHQ